MMGGDFFQRKQTYDFSQKIREVCDICWQNARNLRVEHDEQDELLISRGKEMGDGKNGSE